MSVFFQNLAACAAVGSVCTGVFWLLRHGTRRILGADKQYRFWILLLLLWVLPLRFALPVSVEEECGETAAPDVVTVPFTGQVYLPASPVVEPAPSDGESVIIREDKTFPIQSVLRCVWGIGIFAALAWQFIPYIRFRRLLKHTAVSVDSVVCGSRIPVYRCRSVDSPMVVGVFRPALYLPDAVYTKEALYCILCHEMTHAKRRDIPLKWFAAAVRCVHWWNPLAHLAVRQFSEECEISCDFRASVGMSEEQRRVYMKLLLDLAEMQYRKQGLLTTGFSDSRQFMKRRLYMIQNGKKQKVLAAVLSSLLLAGLCAGLIYGSGVFRDTVLPEETDLPDEIPAVDSLPEETADIILPDSESKEPEETYAQDLEELKQELESIQEEYDELHEEAEEEYYIDGNNEICKEAEEESYIGENNEIYEEEYYISVSESIGTDGVPLILKCDREINAEYGFAHLTGQENVHFHKGVDFQGDTGEAVFSASAGEVSYMGYDYSYGNMIIVKNGDYEICYAHLSKFTPGLAEGDVVEIGTVIGEIGQTGAVTGPHLHFEVRLNGQAIDPASVWVESESCWIVAE
ncbi:MAG: peptidoglycan DD-metalloendopeptidase family protein [Clostridia bacterium]|nr:peptidoglycan DD-metalloendopeptidase family protein [Clostridia bacterium]